MNHIVEQQAADHFWLYDDRILSACDARYFEPAFWYDNHAVVGTEKGRGTTLFLQHEEHELVLRHYLRGGLVGKINKDRYFFRSLDHCRSFSEFRVLLQIQNMGLPVPRPIAAQVVRKGGQYRADILVERIHGACDLLSMLKDVNQSSGFYQSLGQLIARFHKLGVYHADLNIQNILQDHTGQFWLIDFDRARIIDPKQKWQRQTLARLKRSFEKEHMRHQIQWRLSDWHVLEEAYERAMSQHLRP